MAREIARIDIRPGSADPFEAGAAAAQPLFARAAGCSGMELLRSHEVPGRYWLLVEWESVAAHEAFRLTPDFAEWRRLVGDCFAGRPEVEHGVSTT